MKPRYDRLKCADCGVPWEDHATDSRRLCFVMENTTAEEVRQYLADLENLRGEFATVRDRIRALEELPMFHNRQKVERLAPTAGPGGAPVSFGWKVGWVADELVRVRAELEGLRVYLARSIASYIDDAEAWEILDGLSDEDTAMIDRWLTAMHAPTCLTKSNVRPPADPAVPPWTPPETWRLAVVGDTGTWVDLETTTSAVGYAAPGGNAADWTALLLMLRAGTPGRAAMRLAWHAEVGIYCFRNYQEGQATPFRFSRAEAPAVASWLAEELIKLRIRVAVPVLDEAP